MGRITKAVLTLAVFGSVLAVCEHALPKSGAKTAAKAAIGLLFLKLMAEQIAGILQ